jgi:hypothetical protein
MPVPLQLVNNPLRGMVAGYSAADAPSPASRALTIADRDSSEGGQRPARDIGAEHHLADSYGADGPHVVVEADLAGTCGYG